MEAKFKITVIDDNKSVVDLIKEFLEKENFLVSFAYDGRSGLEVIKKEHPDLILLDIIMSDMYGNDVLLQLKNNEDTRDIPVIMLTAKGEEADIVLNWASVGILAEDEWYILRLRLMTAPIYQHPSVWTKVTSWRVPASLHPSALRLGSGQALLTAGPSAEAESHLFRWDVTVVRHTGTRPDGKPDGIAISPMSATRSFFWY